MSLVLFTYTLLNANNIIGHYSKTHFKLEDKVNKLPKGNDLNNVASIDDINRINMPLKVCHRTFGPFYTTSIGILELKFGPETSII